MNNDSLFMQELKLCALAQDFGMNLKSLYNYPLMTFELYIELLNIIGEEGNII